MFRVRVNMLLLNTSAAKAKRLLYTFHWLGRNSLTVPKFGGHIRLKT